jgi:hypothetical protein
MCGAKDAMSLVALNLPENTHDWPDWLERQLVGLELRSLVRQLELIGAEPAGTSLTRLNLDAILGDRRDALLASGLSSLNETQIALLIRHPRVLIDLQELIFEKGGEYWGNVERTPDHESLFIREKQRLSQAFADSLLHADDPKIIESTLPKPTDASQERQTRTVDSRHRTWLLLAAAIAATLLVALLPSFTAQREKGRFFAHRGLLTTPLKDSEFLRQIAQVISSDWDSNSESKETLKKQLIDFRDSCDVLLAASLPQLDTTVAAELKKRCQLWREKIVKNIDQLASNTPFKEVQSDANATIEKLTKFLNELAG